MNNSDLKKFREECENIRTDTATREYMALSVGRAAQEAGASPFVQLMAGDAAYMAKSLKEIEDVVFNAGGNRMQGKAAAKAIGSDEATLKKYSRLQERFYGNPDEMTLQHHMPTWWPEDGTHLHLDQANQARGGSRYYCRNHQPRRAVRKGWWPFAWPSFY